MRSGAEQSKTKTSSLIAEARKKKSKASKAVIKSKSATKAKRVTEVGKTPTRGTKATRQTKSINERKKKSKKDTDKNVLIDSDDSEPTGREVSSEPIGGEPRLEERTDLGEKEPRGQEGSAGGDRIMCEEGESARHGDIEPKTTKKKPSHRKKTPALPTPGKTTLPAMCRSKTKSSATGGADVQDIDENISEVLADTGAQIDARRSEKCPDDLNVMSSADRIDSVSLVETRSSAKKFKTSEGPSSGAEMRTKKLILVDPCKTSPPMKAKRGRPRKILNVDIGTHGKVSKEAFQTNEIQADDIRADDNNADGINAVDINAENSPADGKSKDGIEFLEQEEPVGSKAKYAAKKNSAAKTAQGVYLQRLLPVKTKRGRPGKPVHMKMN